MADFIRSGTYPQRGTLAKTSSRLLGEIPKTVCLALRHCLGRHVVLWASNTAVALKTIPSDKSWARKLPNGLGDEALDVVHYRIGGSRGAAIGKQSIQGGNMAVAGTLDCGEPISIVLLGGFEFLSQGTTIDLPQGAQRLLAYLALRGSSHRSRAAESLWPDSPPARAAANLRSALWRVRNIGARTVIECNGPRLRLSRETRVDLTEVRKYADRVGNDSAAGGALDAVAGLGRELVPEWTEDWLILERQRWDQERLHTLEQLAIRLLAAEEFLPAMQTALTAIAIEPIRETAHRTVIEIHMAEGNCASALQHYKNFRDMLDRELGVAPSQHMIQLTRRLTAW